MDWNAEVLWGYSALVVIAVGVGIFVVAKLWGTKVMTSGAAKGLMWIGAIVAVVGLVVAAGVWSPQTASVDKGATYDISMSESMSHVTVDNDDLIVYCNIDFNYTGDGAFMNQTQYALINFTLDRTDDGTGADTTTVECTDVGNVADDTAGDSYTLVSKGTNWAINWTKAMNPDAATITTTSKQGLSTTIHVESGGSNWVLVNVTWHNDAIDALAQYENAYAYFDIGGNQVQFVVRVIAYAGVAPT